MPWILFAEMTNEDLGAIYAYLRTLKRSGTRWSSTPRAAPEGGPIESREIESPRQFGKMKESCRCLLFPLHSHGHGGFDRYPRDKWIERATGKEGDRQWDFDAADRSRSLGCVEIEDEVSTDRASIRGYSREELLSTPITAIHSKEMPELLAFAQSVFDQGHGWTNELSCMTKSGEALPAEISASVIKIAETPASLPWSATLLSASGQRLHSINTQRIWKGR